MTINDKLKNILIQLRSHFEQIYDSRLVTMVLYGSQARGDAICGCGAHKQQSRNVKGHNNWWLICLNLESSQISDLTPSQNIY